ncbi:MAG: PTS sugar transporter subunit IIC [Erysipelotrichaceae bacterium]
MSILQALLVGCVAALTQFEGGWLGECKLREPVVTGFLVGLILGDVQKGLIIGAELQMMWMGATGIGPTAQLNIGTGGTIGTAVALMTGKGAAIAITFGLPVAVIMQFLDTLLMTGYSGLMHTVDKRIDEMKDKSIEYFHYFCGFCTFLMYFSLTFIVMYFGNSVIQGIVDGFPAWANSGLAAVSKILPAMGFALLLNLLLEKDLIPFFILGFIITAYTELTMVAVTAIAIGIAWIVYLLKSSSIDAAKKDEWEDETL